MVDDLLKVLEQIGQNLHAGKIKKVYDQKIARHKLCERCREGRIGPMIKPLANTKCICKVCINIKYTF